MGILMSNMVNGFIKVWEGSAVMIRWPWTRSVTNFHARSTITINMLVFFLQWMYIQRTLSDHILCWYIHCFTFLFPAIYLTSRWHTFIHPHGNTTDNNPTIVEIGGCKLIVPFYLCNMACLGVTWMIYIYSVLMFSS